VKDWRGVEVKVGDRVLYATRAGSSMTIVEGNVLDIVGDDAKVHVVNESGGWRFEPRKRPTIVSGRYLTVVTGLPEATDDAAHRL